MRRKGQTQPMTMRRTMWTTGDVWTRRPRTTIPKRSVQKVKFQFHFYKMDKKLIVIDEPIIISG